MSPLVRGGGSTSSPTMTSLGEAEASCRAELNAFDLVFWFWVRCMSRALDAVTWTGCGCDQGVRG